ncbi:MAG TPA: agmatine deiminase family protein [Desulfosporosinus sp.]|nr:agmatine deiminase family protein [Desulfosporosinus sp.]
MYPTNLNYKMPAEWVKHLRTYISWPVQSSMCYPEDYDAVCQGYAEIIEAIAEFEPVTVVVNPADSDNFFNLFQSDQIEGLVIKHNDAWLRDNGPTFLIRDTGGLAGVNWQFNAWGGKYAPWDLDNQVAPQMLDCIGVKCFNTSLVMEGGAFHVDGEGTLLTTEQCLLNSNRNPERTRDQIEEELKKFLSVRKVVWLKKGLDGDETDGHVDNIACFGAPGKILIQVCDDPEDANYSVTQENLKILSHATDALGRKFELVPIQQPPILYAAGTSTRYTLSYLNFYFVNGGLILPVFGGEAAETDRLAAQVLGELFPERRIRTVNGMAIIREGGNVHCITQQMPEGVG